LLRPCCRAQPVWDFRCSRCISLTLLCLHDTLTLAVIRAIAVYVVPLIAGVAIGAAGFRLVSSGMYSRAILAITLLSGLALRFR
jgi:predicted Co/Zn/Cd cation transporter (cation efflux family)